MTLPPNGRTALRTWASGLKLWWAWCKLWWALTWRYAGAAWLLLAALGFLVLIDILPGTVVSFGIIGLVLFAGWCGREVLHFSQPASEEGSRFGDQWVLQPLDVRASAWVLAAAFMLVVFGMLSLSDAASLEAGLPLGLVAFAGGAGELLQNEILHGALVIPLGALFFSESYLVQAASQTLGLALMFLAWSHGLMRKSISSGSRTLVLLAVLLVIFNMVWAVRAADEDGTFSPVYLRWTVSAIGLGIGFFGLWCQRRPSFWKALAFSWLVFAWAWAAPTAPFRRPVQAEEPKEDYSKFCTTDSQAWKGLLRILGEQFGEAGGKVSPKSNLIEELDLDAYALDYVDLVMALEVEFEVDMSDEAVETLVTAGDWCGYIVALQGSAGSETPSARPQG